MSQGALGSSAFPTTGGWSASDRFVVLGHDFSIETTDLSLRQYLNSLLQTFARGGRARTTYTFLDLGPGVHDRYELYFEGELQIRESGGGSALAHLFQHINSSIVTESDQHLLIHGAAAEHDGQAVVLPAPSASGKSTLVGALVRAGLGYITDEFVALDPATGQIEPVPKPLSIECGSWHLLPEFEPQLSSELKRYATPGWLADARTIRPDALAPMCPPAFVVFPAYRAGGPTQLVPLRRAETVMVLIENAFNLTVHGGRGLELLAAVAHQAPGYRLEMGDLGLACELVVRLITTSATTRTPSATKSGLPM